MNETIITEIRPVRNGGVEVSYEVWKECLPNDFGKPSKTRCYTYSVVIPPGKLKDVEKAMKEAKKWKNLKK